MLEKHLNDEETAYYAKNDTICVNIIMFMRKK